MKRLSFGYLVALVAFMAATALAQEQQVLLDTIQRYDFDFTGGGARAEGMGKAFIAVSDDITAGSWNPAGLYELEKPILAFSYGSLAPRGSTNSNFLNEGIAKLDHAGSFGDVTSVNFVAPIRIKGHHFVGSVNFTRNYDDFQALALYGDTAFEFVLSGNLDTFNLDFDVAWQFQGGLNSVNIGFGTRLYKNLSFGTSVNMYTGEAVGDLEQVLDWERYPFYPGQLADRIELTRVVDTNKFSGYNVTVGFKLNGEKLDAGLIIRTPFSLNVKTGRSVHQTVEEGALDAGQLLTVDSLTVFFDDIYVKYDMPLMVGGGIGYWASENLLLAADAEYRLFSGRKVRLRDSVKIDPGGTTQEFFTEQDRNWNNVITLRMGGEYLHKTGIGLIPIRGGWGYVPLHNPNINLAGGTSTAVSYNLSLGTGIHWSQIHLDWAYTYSTVKWEESDPTTSVEQKSRNHHLNFSFTGFF